MAADPGQLRIGEFARRVGVTPELLRAWESRYGLTRPVRSPGGFRLYTAADATRVERMRRGLDQGLSAAEAARAALADERPSEGLLEDAAARLLAAICRYDEAAAHSALDESLAALRPGGVAAPRGVAHPETGRRRLGARRDRDQPGALREQPHPRQTLRARPVLGPRHRPARAPRLRARRDARHHPARVRARPALARLAHPVSRRRHADRDAHPDGGDDEAGTRGRLELRPLPARGASRRAPPAGPARAACARRPRRDGRALAPGWARAAWTETSLRQPTRLRAHDPRRSPRARPLAASSRNPPKRS